MRPAWIVKKSRESPALAIEVIEPRPEERGSREMTGSGACSGDAGVRSASPAASPSSAPSPRKRREALSRDPGVGTFVDAGWEERRAGIRGLVVSPSIRAARFALLAFVLLV